MAFCFSGSLLRANFSIVSLYFLFDGVIVRGKYIFSSSPFSSFRPTQGLVAKWPPYWDDSVLGFNLTYTAFLASKSCMLLQSPTRSSIVDTGQLPQPPSKWCRKTRFTRLPRWRVARVRISVQHYNRWPRWAEIMINIRYDGQLCIYTQWLSAADPNLVTTIWQCVLRGVFFLSPSLNFAFAITVSITAGTTRLNLQYGLRQRKREG